MLEIFNIFAFNITKYVITMNTIKVTNENAANWKPNIPLYKDNWMNNVKRKRSKAGNRGTVVSLYLVRLKETTQSTPTYVTRPIKNAPNTFLRSSDSTGWTWITPICNSKNAKDVMAVTIITLNLVDTCIYILILYQTFLIKYFVIKINS